MAAPGSPKSVRDAFLVQDGDGGVDGTHAWHVSSPSVSSRVARCGLRPDRRSTPREQGGVVEAAVAVGLRGGHQLGDHRAERDDHTGLAGGGR